MIPENVFDQIKTKKVLVQLPEGLKPKAREICDALNARGFEPIISGDACFGACDLKFFPDCTTLHFAHTKMIDAENVVYVPFEYDVDCVPVALLAMPLLGERVCLFTTSQHLKQLPKIKEALESQGKKVVLLPASDRTQEGQVLGCSKLEKQNVDSYLFVGTGLFHALNGAFQLNHSIVRADPFTNEFEEVDDQFSRESALRRTKASNAKSFGVLVSSKPGQQNLKLAKETVDKLKTQGKRACLVYSDLITNDSLVNLSFDAYVVTACPRIVLDDWKNYSKPILLPDEI